MSPGSVFQDACQSRRLLDILAEKWVLLIVHALADGPMRTSQLRRQIGGISEKMLIQSLRTLEQHGLIERRSYDEVPPRVDYRLTELGASLRTVVRAFDEWVQDNAEAVMLVRG